MANTITDLLKNVTGSVVDAGANTSSAVSQAANTFDELKIEAQDAASQAKKYLATQLLLQVASTVAIVIVAYVTWQRYSKGK